MYASEKPYERQVLFCAQTPSLVNQVSLVLELSRWRVRSETGVKQHGSLLTSADTLWKSFSPLTCSQEKTISHDTKLTKPLVASRLSSCAITQIKTYSSLYHITLQCCQFSCLIGRQTSGKTSFLLTMQIAL